MFCRANYTGVLGAYDFASIRKPIDVGGGHETAKPWSTGPLSAENNQLMSEGQQLKFQEGSTPKTGRRPTKLSIIIRKSPTFII